MVGRLWLATVCLILSMSTATADVQRRDQDEAAWKSLRAEYFGDRAIADGQDVVTLDAPYRAEDPAVVPITISDLRAGTDEPPIRKLWLVIDNNPVPMSAQFEFGPAAGSATIALRVRVNSYTYMRVLAESSDGQLYMVKRYVKASGGCSAPIGRDLNAARQNMGEMRLRRVRIDDGDETRSQLMIRHPNITGLQMDQLTRLVEPAHFVDAITLRKGDALVLDSTMTFSLSANPSLQFDVARNAAGELTAEVQDNKGNQFRQTWPADAGASQAKTTDDGTIR
ncbi:MAG: quinoprotein dehydrogenase-associated SoxYZ-like carrier [Salinisphaera sp.]|nr:quinoprotein dehydrogenase-associated SoxYZ-like carrier [Salinisphaera sp.]